MDFNQTFTALAGHVPLPWQTRMFDGFLTGNIPHSVDIPTGLGKTSVIQIWLIALASNFGKVKATTLHRRLVYIVNRRTVVDQATGVVELMRERLRNPHDEKWRQHGATLNELAGRLRVLSASDAEGVPLGVSTLRGEMADNEEWKTDPARPAIIVGTIDMIGSKLLFSGYGDGRYGRAHHAGLIGQDALIVHDEAHLTPAFSGLLRALEQEQGREVNRDGQPSTITQPIRVVELSATQRGGDGHGFQLEPDDEADERTGTIVKQRLDAKKRLCLHTCDDVVAGLVERANAHVGAPSKVLIYVRSPKDAQNVAKAIRSELGNGAEERVALLTGTIRGCERDRLVAENPVYQALLDPDATVPHAVFLVSTSAGEVGIDLDADHLVSDVTTLDSMIQRLGRVNRRGGEGREARVDVVWTQKDATPGDQASQMQVAAASTLKLLQRWAADSMDGLLVSPRNLRALLDTLGEQEREAAFSPKPAARPLTDILLDNWSLTSIDKMPGRPEVAAYLHGMTADPPETYVAWRKEVAALHEAGADESSVRDWFRACRIETRERLRDQMVRVRKALVTLLEEHQKRKEKTGQGFEDFPVVLLDERGGAEWSTVSAVARKPDRNERDVLRYRTVVLPVEAGGLDWHGMLDGKATDPTEDIDVAEATTGNRQRQRWLHIQSPDGERFERLASGKTAEALPPGLPERERITLASPEEGAEDEGERRELILLTEPAEAAVENPERARFCQRLGDHTRQIEKHADRIGEALNLPDRMREAIVCAARWHDRGKDRSCWQYYACNEHGDEPLAKSKRYRDPRRALGGYRHEFGSQLEAMADEYIANHPERELIVHLIAAHHGWARPHFEHRAFDHEGPRDGASGERRAPTSAKNEAAAVEAMQRFGRLQQRFGRWGLAWLESLLRCADIAASQPSEANRGRQEAAASTAPAARIGSQTGGPA